MKKNRGEESLITRDFVSPDFLEWKVSEIEWKDPDLEGLYNDVSLVWPNCCFLYNLQDTHDLTA